MREYKDDYNEENPPREFEFQDEPRPLPQTETGTGGPRNSEAFRERLRVRRQLPDQHQDPPGMDVEELYSSKWKGMEISESDGFESSTTNEAFAFAWFTKKRRQLLFILFVMAIIVYFTTDRMQARDSASSSTFFDKNDAALSDTLDIESSSDDVTTASPTTIEDTAELESSSTTSTTSPTIFDAVDIESDDVTTASPTTIKDTAEPESDSTTATTTPTTIDAVDTESSSTTFEEDTAELESDSTTATTTPTILDAAEPESNSTTFENDAAELESEMMEEARATTTPTVADTVDIESENVTASPTTTIVDTVGIIESCDTILEAEKDVGIPAKSFGSCETSDRKPYWEKIDDLEQMKADVNLISNDGKFDSVKRFVLFFASGRSGHTWLGAILDAAPNAMIANQRNTLKDYFYKMNPDDRSRNRLYEFLAYNSWHCGNSPEGWVQVYNYTIPGLWQGRIDTSNNEQLEVIGDKSGGGAIHILKKWIKEVAGKDFDLAFGDYDAVPGLVDYVNKKLEEYISVIQAEPKFIVNIRHPGNIVATSETRHHAGEVKKLSAARAYGVLGRIRSSLWVMENVGKKEYWHLVVTEKFATDTEEELIKMCDFVGLSCPQLMIDTVVNQTHHSVHETWKNVAWELEFLVSYNDFITKYLSEWYQPMCQ